MATTEVPLPPLEGDYVLVSKNGIVAWLPAPKTVETSILATSKGRIAWLPIVAKNAPPDWLIPGENWQLFFARTAERSEEDE